MKTQKLLQTLCLTLVLTLVMEGMLRKLFPALSVAIFLLKDIIIVMMLPLMARMRNDRWSSSLLFLLGTSIILFLPPFLNTFVRDPVLGFFGAKQYLLYPVFAVALIYAFRDAPDAFSRFILRCALLIYPVVILALLQRQLPASNILNMSVGQEDLSDFTSGGYLRVSGSFSFVAQFAWFLLAMVFILPTAIVWRPKEGLGKWLLLAIVPSSLLVAGLFATGSRTAVLGAIAIVMAATFFIICTGRTKSISWLISMMGAGVVVLLIVNITAPDVVGTYRERFVNTSTFGTLYGIYYRVHDSLTSWTLGFRYYEPTFLGYGLGVMSNGVQSISAYAAEIRNSGVWGETDLKNTVFEGGYYLVFVWISIRMVVVILCILAFFQTQRSRYIFPAAFALAHVCLIGLTATLGTQPPWAIWWWLSVGVVFVFNRLDLHYRKQKLLDDADPQDDAEEGLAQAS